jgi:hypothetical protein
MTLASPLRKVATKLMKTFGGVVTIRFVATGVYNATTGTSSETTADVLVRGILEAVHDREVNGLIKSGDQKLTVAAADLPAKPTVADQVLSQSILYQIAEVKTIEQDNSAIVYELFLTV